MKLLRLLLLTTAILITAQSAQALEVIRAFYGVGECWADVTGIVQDCVNRGDTRIRVTNRSMGGDPAPNIRKALYVEYQTRGQVLKASASENSWLVLRGGAPEGSYGSPEGGYAGASEIRFRNRTGESLRVYTVNEYGQWQWVTILAPGARYATPSQRGQLFVVTNPYNEVIRRVQAGRGGETISIP